MDQISKKKSTILIVDDSPDSVALLSSLLSTVYRVKIAISGEKALAIAGGADAPDLILLDVVMPGLDGYETCRLLKRDPATSDIPVIFLTGRSDAVDEEKGLRLGAVDYISKPPSPSIVLARIGAQIRLKEMRDFLRDKNAYLESEVARRTNEIVTIQDVMMIAMGSLAETRDNDTGNHIRRTQYFMRLLAERLRGHHRFEGFLAAESVELLYKSAPLHDIGKVGIPDRILKKPEKLDPEEFEIMKTHTIIGRDAILAAERRLGSQNSFLSLAREIAWTHHEKWDGTGYPRGLSGDDIPIPGRLMAIADVYDALISRRAYKAAFTHGIAVEIIRKGAGTHFDPDIVEAFLRAEPEFDEVARRFSDSEDRAP
ncbi:MAG: two-component system response regulator [Spirochaetes bacterium]|nr:two-component system response regulator [Spirochaetota bacterium]MBU1081458.1 two-component system response regulator [Spirochaetota bacterium]